MRERIVGEIVQICFKEAQGNEERIVGSRDGFIFKMKGITACLCADKEGESDDTEEREVSAGAMALRREVGAWDGVEDLAFDGGTGNCIPCNRREVPCGDPGSKRVEGHSGCFYFLSEMACKVIS